MVEHHVSNRKFFKKCRYIIAVSNDLREKFLNDYPNLKHRVRVIYNGVDDTLFTPDSNEKKYSDFTALYVGRVDREKGIDLLINAVNIAIKEGAKVKAKIVGMGIHVYDFKNLVKSLGLMDSIEFVGQVKNNELVEYYQKSHVFVLPTRREEGHPMTVSEAFCSGLPVIASKKGGLVELIVDSKDGYFIDTQSATSLAYLLKHLSEKPEILKEMSAEARKSGEKKYSKRAMILGYNTILDKI
jgi:glycosyltransferase involved in cell wall biosynthesis